MTRNRKIFWMIFGIAGFSLLATSHAWAAAVSGSNLTLSIGGSGKDSTEVAGAMKILIFMTALSVAPAILLTMTSFTRIVIVLSLLRQAIGVHQSPPNQVVVGLSLFLTVFLMGPVLKEVQSKAITPFLDEKIDYKTAFDEASGPLKKFMFRQTTSSDMNLMISLSHLTPEERPKDLNAMPITMLIPAFVLSELKTAFQIGFLIYLPFVMIDMVISMVLLTTGMMMLPPVIISLPFKLMLFILVDGWNLVVGSLMSSFN
jgi:flagellar biosynthetic protein FliP